MTGLSSSFTMPLMSGEETLEHLRRIDPFHSNRPIERLRSRYSAPAFRGQGSERIHW
jgi:hypothetical protein